MYFLYKMLRQHPQGKCYQWPWTIYPICDKKIIHFWLVHRQTDRNEYYTFCTIACRITNFIYFPEFSLAAFNASLKESVSSIDSCISYRNFPQSVLESCIFKKNTFPSKIRVKVNKLISKATCTLNIYCPLATWSMDSAEKVWGKLLSRCETFPLLFLAPELFRRLFHWETHLLHNSSGAGVVLEHTWHFLLLIFK